MEKRALLVSPHPDDVEIGAGGTIARLKRSGWTVWEIYFCPCWEDPKNVGHLEDHRKVVAALGIDNLIELKFPRDGYLETHKQEVRDILWKLKKKFKPTLVLCPSPHEFHQDHAVVAKCCQTIFRDTSTILGYEIGRSNLPDFKPNCFIILTEEDVQTKLKALLLYKSQLKNRAYFFNSKVFESTLIVRGAMAKTKWAEAFELLWGRI